jgi:hypothetical protein
MKKIYIPLILFCLHFFCFSQEGFNISNKSKKTSIPFKLINNLITIPVKVNNVPLTFLLDTGLEKTVLFSLENTDSLLFKNIKKIKIRGLGAGESIDAFQSKENTVSIDKLVDNNHEIYIILDQEVNFSSQLGIPVHGIIGYWFFKNNTVEINYKSKKIHVYKNIETIPPTKLKRFEEIPLSIEIGKPYINSISSINSKKINTKMLIDTGGSDALWLFENSKDISAPTLFFEDFLGRGFSGNIFGKRSRIEQFSIGKYTLEDPTVSFPDTLSLRGMTIVNGRSGSIGGSILKRFHLIMDYPNQKMLVKSNVNFRDPFNYNMSGLEVQHNGLEWVKEEFELKTQLVNTNLYNAETESRNLKYRFVLKPVYEITNVRKNSPAALSGIMKGDKIGRFNGVEAFKFKLHEINEILQSEEGKWISLEIERNQRILKFKFQLKKIL